MPVESDPHIAAVFDVDVARVRPARAVRDDTVVDNTPEVLNENKHEQNRAELRRASI